MTAINALIGSYPATFPKEKLGVLSEDDQYLALNIVPWLLFFCKISEVNAKTIPVLCVRSKLYVDCVKWETPEAFVKAYEFFGSPEWWGKWEGMEINIKPSTNAEWFKCQLPRK